MTHKRFRLVFALAFLTGCASIIGVPDLTLEETPGGPDGGGSDGARSDGASQPADAARDGRAEPHDADVTDAPITTPDSGDDAGDADSDAATCDLSAVQDDPLNCGACNHACLVGTGCANGFCGAKSLATVPANIVAMIEHDGYLYATADFKSGVDAVGVWRVDKSDGTAVLFAPLRGADRAAIIGDTLWLSARALTQDPDFPSDDKNGGLYRCALAAPPPCTPELVLPVDHLTALQAVGGSKLQYLQYDVDRYVTFDTSVAVDAGADAAAAVTADWQTSYAVVDSWADPPATYGSTVFSDSVGVFYQPTMDPAGSSLASFSTGSKWGVYHGQIVGGPRSVYYTASEYFKGLAGAVLRIDRATSTSCALGGADAGAPQVLRPLGVYVDSKHVFWTNQGDYQGGGGSVAVCDVDTCCPDPRLLWTGAASIATVIGDTERLFWSTDELSGDVIYVSTKP